MLRLFTALDPPLAIRQQLLLLRRSIPGARWQTVEQMHITISFIGEVEKSLLPEIKEALATITTTTPLELNLNGVDYFGSNRQPRVLFAKIEPNPSLSKLNRRINNALFEIGLKTEKQKFIPHITLARLKQTAYQSVGQFMQSEALLKTEFFMLNEFHLISSKLSVDGSQYLIEESYPLDSTS
ncbi:MAG: RNA 2',3'-cyclic phosphodiesterase [Methylococcaceae bacterium]